MLGPVSVRSCLWLAWLVVVTLAPGAGARPRAVPRTGVCDTLLPLGVKFRFGTGARPAAAPTLGPRGEVYVGTVDGIVHALGPDGSYRWSYTLRGPVIGRSLVDSEGRLLVPTRSSIYAIRPDGSLSWEFHSPVAIQGDLLRDGRGKIRFASEDGRLFEFDERGALIRNVRASYPWSALPVALRDGSIAGGSRSGLVLLSASSGVSRYELERPVEQVLRCPGERVCAVAGGRLEVLGDGGGFRAPAWRAASRGDFLAIVSDDRTLSLYRGTPLYRVVLPDTISSAPAVTEDGSAYVPLAGGALVAVTAQGRIRGCEQVGHSVLATPVLAPDGSVLVSGGDGVIAALLGN
jgi:outer membrane protein assembly factor BamB